MSSKAGLPLTPIKRHRKKKKVMGGMNKSSSATEKRPGCMAGEAARLHTPLPFDAALRVSDFTLTKGCCLFRQRLEPAAEPRGLPLQPVQSARERDGKSLLLRLQPRGRGTLAAETGRKAFAHCHLAPAVQGARAGGEGEK